MIIDYLESGSIGCPLIRLKHGNPEDYDILIEAIKTLIIDNKEIDLFSLKGFYKGIDIQKLFFSIGESDKAIQELNHHGFTCQFTKQHLLDIIEKLESYKKTGGSQIFNWLNDDLGIALLLSYDGTW